MDLDKHFKDKKSSQSLLGGLLTSQADFEAKLLDYTDSKCLFSRRIDQCTLEMLYYTN